MAQKYAIVPIDKIKPHPRNPNRGNVKAIGESIAKNGFYGACVVQQSTGLILAGNHRYEAAKAHGEAKIPVIYIDCDDATATRILLADNGTRSKAKADPHGLAELLRGLGDPVGIGYDQDEIEVILRSVLPRPEYLQNAPAGGDGPMPDEAPLRDDSGRYPLAIVLDGHEWAKWLAYKKQTGEKNDKAAFLALL